MFEHMLLNGKNGGQAERVIPFVNKGPGPDTIIKGDADLGYFGKMPIEDIATSSQLSSILSFSGGTLLTLADNFWLKYVFKGKVRFVPKLPLRRSLNWAELQTHNLIDGSRIVNINGQDYKIQLMEGINSDPLTEDPIGWDIPPTHGSEWNQVMYRLHSGVHIDANNTLASENITESWESFSDADLRIHSSTGAGSNVWCKETSFTPTNAILRGQFGISRIVNGVKTNDVVGSSTGWKPVLEPL